MPSVSIRPATPSDVDAILHCLHTAFAPFRSHYSAEGFADTTLTPQTARERLKTMSVYVAEADGMIVGTIACNVVNQQSQITNQQSPEGHLRGMAVLPDWQGRGPEKPGSSQQHNPERKTAEAAGWQGRGVAEQLLAAAEAELRRRGCRRITLDTTAPLQRAIRFYERHGYTASGKVTDFYGMPLYEYVKQL